MQTLSLMQQTLGEAWPRLAPPIRAHYTLRPGYAEQITVHGELQVDFPLWVMPLLKMIRLFGGLLDRRSAKVVTTVRKWTKHEDAGLFWHRELRYPDGKQKIFKSEMQHLHSNELIEYVGGGFGLRLLLSEENGNLVYRSNGHVLRFGPWLFTFPDWLLLGYATISEQALSENSFRLDFAIYHPWWGRTFAYRGVFQVSQDISPKIDHTALIEPTESDLNRAI